MVPPSVGSPWLRPAGYARKGAGFGRTPCLQSPLPPCGIYPEDAYLHCSPPRSFRLALDRSPHKHPMDILTPRRSSMPGPVTYSRSGPLANIVMNDGKANVMSETMLNRSEERRVGKECRARWSQHGKEGKSQQGSTGL